MTLIPPEWEYLRAALPRLVLLYDLSLLLLPAVAQPLAALPPYGCGTPLAGNRVPAIFRILTTWFASIFAVALPAIR